ncbi:hypothetical protein BDN70DRAFT_937231 [Pholiota conissans]|uniref:DUF6699 domain-containing protein n=1 Tax=Pholiota conissans TaxID=109636 RepID=A0A9P5YPU7_9AGAR|nr:hypothetical protein BDN70DRAFT_937231 [Pholiota conissans]
MKGNFACSRYNYRASTPAGQRQNVLGANAFAVEPTTVNDNLHSSHILDQGWRRHVEIPNVSVQVQHVPYSGRQYRDTHDDSVWISNEHPGYTPHAYLGGPPPLPPVAPIPLPPLSPTTPIQTHPLITYRLHHAKVNSPILWNISLPPSTARLAAALNSAPSWPWWQEVAVWPNGLPSMTIRVQGVQRPIVVFPCEIGHQISILDVMNAVSNAVRTSVVVASNAGESSTTHLIFRPGPDDVNQEFDSVNAVPSDTSHRHFRGQVWWAGLRASTDEVDVWILQLQGRRRGGRH